MLRPFTPRPYAGEHDLAPLGELINSNYALDWPDHDLSVDDIRRCWITAPHADPARDICLWEDATRQLVAAGLLQMRPPSTVLTSALFDWFIQPTARQQGLEEAVHRWSVARVGERAQSRGQAGRLECRTWAGAAYRHAVLDVQGYRAVRYGFKMTCSLAGWLPRPRLPPGYTLRHVRSAADLRAWVEAYNDTFADNWGFRPWTEAEHRHWLSAPGYRAAGDLIAIAPDGTLAAFCLCRIDPAANQPPASREGCVALLGTRSEYRHQGLGRALLLSGIRWLRAAGVARAVLTVDVENPTGILQLSESVGFIQTDGQVIYQRDIQVGEG